jgi:RHS repeat-associated protein
VSVHDSTGPVNYVYFADVQGNIGQVVDLAAGSASVSMKARYEYDAYGNRTVTGGTYTQPFGFSTKYYDAESGFAYFGYAYYSPVLGRWINRELADMTNASSAYCYLHNDAVNGTAVAWSGGGGGQRAASALPAGHGDPSGGTGPASRPGSSSSPPATEPSTPASQPSCSGHLSDAGTFVGAIGGTGADARQNCRSYITASGSKFSCNCDTAPWHSGSGFLMAQCWFCSGACPYDITIEGPCRTFQACRGGVSATPGTGCTCKSVILCGWPT